jgi:hypothetical protein
MTAQEVQHALTYSQRSPFYRRTHLVVPNVSWGLGFQHELDLLSISYDSRAGTEIEIKVSIGDLKRDRDKKHGHSDVRIRQLYFAGPIELQEAFFEYAPADAGIITVFFNAKEWGDTYQCVTRRRPKPRNPYRKFTDTEIDRLLRLSNMRYWSLFSRQFRKKEQEQ